MRAAYSETGRSYAISAHLMSWKVHFGAVPERCRIVRTCKNKLCVNPKHLKAVTQGKDAKQPTDRPRGVSPMEFAERAVPDPFGKPPRAASMLANIQPVVTTGE